MDWAHHYNVDSCDLVRRRKRPRVRKSENVQTADAVRLWESEAIALLSAQLLERVPFLLLAEELLMQIAAKQRFAISDVAAD